MRVHFITFGGPTENYHRRVNTICEEASNSNFFDVIKGYNDQNIDEEFKLLHSTFLKQNQKGYGYWLWKSFIISNYLNKHCNMDDILIYADAGCTINKQGFQRFHEYLDMLKHSHNGVIAFQMDHLKENNYSKKTLLNYMNTNLHDATSGQCHATIVMLRRCTLCMSIIYEWYQISSKYELINDENNDGIEHRHDQSIYSLLVKKHNCSTISDETYFPLHQSVIKFNYPFWATRIRN